MEKKTLMKYSAAMATGLVAGNASPTIIYTDIDDITISGSDVSNLYLDFEGQSASTASSAFAGADLYFYAGGNYFSAYCIGNNLVASDNNYNLLEFSAEQEIGSSSSFSYFGYISSFYSTTFGPEMGQYAGVSLNGNYGWIQLSYDSDRETLKVYDFAYEDSGTPITAGAIPEPSAMALIALTGTAMLAARRRFSA
jgi:hypothetical protein